MEKIKKCKGKMCVGDCSTCRHSTSWGYPIKNSRNYWCKLYDKEVEPGDWCGHWE
ncbi:MAG: hypothetical protein IJQ67_01140 [Bacilli bacterium]|nr:hypothetical protein [Bacilli bacterium]